MHRGSKYEFEQPVVKHDYGQLFSGMTRFGVPPLLDHRCDYVFVPLQTSVLVVCPDGKGCFIDGLGEWT